MVPRRAARPSPTATSICSSCSSPRLENDGRPIDAKPVTVEEYEAQEWPLYQAVKEEGILL
ncbi:MAG: hypothetical protein AMS14_11550 [Planctomycetes bacterium DG_20]|nr:MAG: hypothetical protein AMS14_11550 [Planctomycetes bacterium DG_20]